jgi:hypothetical protein
MCGVVDKYHAGGKGKRLFAPMMKKKRCLLQTTPLDEVGAYLVSSLLFKAFVLFKAY